jgi:hypothetical protein
MARDAGTALVHLEVNARMIRGDVTKQVFVGVGGVTVVRPEPRITKFDTCMRIIDYFKLRYIYSLAPLKNILDFFILGKIQTCCNRLKFPDGRAADHYWVMPALRHRVPLSTVKRDEYH